MRRDWSFHRSSRRKKRMIWIVLLGIGLFVLGFFAAHPICRLFGWI